jgi:hypothetical protein
MECPVRLLAAGRRDDAALFNLRQPAIMLPDTGRYRCVFLQPSSHM